MLHEFLKANRTELIERCRAKVAVRRAPRATPAQIEHGVPLFLDQLTTMLASEDAGADPAAHEAAARTAAIAESRIAHDATKHGEELLRHDFTIEQVVHDYGDLCQSITELATEQRAPITVEEFGILNIRLDNAIAGAVSEFSLRSAVSRRDDVAVLEASQRLGFLVHEMRNLLSTTMLAVAAIRGGRIGWGGATAAALDRSLLGLRTLIDRTLAEVRLEGGIASERETIDIGSFISELRVESLLQAGEKGCELIVDAVEPGLRVEGDRQLLATAVSHLLQNAFKFTRPGSRVFLRVRSSNDRVSIEVEDECGGLPPGVEDRIFRPFVQHGAQRRGVGLGLPLSFDSVRALGGRLHVRDAPGTGCAFIIDLPLKA